MTLALLEPICWLFWSAAPLASLQEFKNYSWEKLSRIDVKSLRKSGIDAEFAFWLEFLIYVPKPVKMRCMKMEHESGSVGVYVDKFG